MGIYSIYADAGTKDDGVTVMAGVGKLMQTMTKYAADDMVNITLRDITAIAQTQKAGSFDLNGWKDDQLAGTQTPRSMNLHYGINAVVDYGLHDEDGGKIIYPFFTTDEGFLRTRVEQNTDAPVSYTHLLCAAVFQQDIGRVHILIQNIAFFYFCIQTKICLRNIQQGREIPCNRQVFRFTI